MNTINIHEAKTHFSQILTEVENGEAVVITRHGKKVAFLSVFKETTNSADPIQEAIDTIINLRSTIRLNESDSDEILSIKAMKEEGRR